MVTGVGTMSTVSNAQQVPLKEVQTPPVKSDRRSNKPIMEKRRRARINNCLNELKTLILDATKKDPARHSKLEKADILEKTVKHLQELQRQQSVMVQATDPKIVNKFKAGFTECANEVSRFPGLDTQVKRRLMQHLSNCINGVKSELSQIRQQSQIISSTPQQQQQVHILPSPPSSPEQDHHHNQHHNNQQQIHQQQQQQQQHMQTTTTISTTQIQATVNGYFLPNGVQVYPTKLSNGTFALILPQTVPQATQLPMLVPIPSRTASTGSATSLHSNGSNYDRTHSPIIMNHQHLQQQNLINHYAPPSPANSYEAMDCQPNNHHQHHHQSVIHHASSSHHQLQQQQNNHLNNRQSPDQQHIQSSYSPDIDTDDGPISLVMKKNNDSIKEEEQPWRPW